MTETTLALLFDLCRDAMVARCRAHLRAPRCVANSMASRRLARERLAILGASPAERAPTRRQRATSCSHVRARLPAGRIKRG